MERTPETISSSLRRALLGAVAACPACRGRDLDRSPGFSITRSGIQLNIQAHCRRCGASVYRETRPTASVLPYELDAGLVAGI
jgi:hypothetical protein